MPKKVELSVIIPIHNEEQNLEPFYNELKDHLKFISNYEIIFVDDGSLDSSFNILNKLSKKDKKLKIIKLKTRCGQSIAIRAGLDHSIGEKIVSLDGDGQHHPKYIQDFYKKLEYFDVVCNRRLNWNKSSTNFGNFLIKTLFNVNLKDSVGGMKAFRKQVKNHVYLYGDMHRYLPLLALWKGFKVTDQEIVIRRRARGKTKYKIKKTFKGFLDLLTVKFFVSYSTRPSHIFGTAGLLSLGIGGLAVLYLLLAKIFFSTPITSSLPLFLLGILLILIGFNFIFFGFLGDMMSYNHLSQNNEKNYIVDEILK